jgi:hypothetical protein
MIIFIYHRLFLFCYTNEKKDGMAWPPHSQINIWQLLCYRSYMGIYPKIIFLLSLWLRLPTTCTSLNILSVIPYYLQAANFTHSIYMVWLFILPTEHCVRKVNTHSYFGHPWLESELSRQRSLVFSLIMPRKCCTRTINWHVYIECLPFIF